MLRVVFDTNIYISTIHFGGQLKDLIFLALEKKLQLYISNEIIVEILGVLAKKFKYPKQKLNQIEFLIKDLANIVQPRETITVIKNWPADNRILECAVASKADYIVTGDKQHLLPLKKFRETKIVSVTEFLNLIE